MPQRLDNIGALKKPASIPSADPSRGREWDGMGWDHPWLEIVLPCFEHFIFRI